MGNSAGKIGKAVLVKRKDGDGFIGTIFKPFDQTRTYLASCDISEGTGNDYSVLYIWDVTESSNITTAAMFAGDKITPAAFAFTCSRILALYANPMLICENNGVGAAFIDTLRETHEYPSFAKFQGRCGIHSGPTTKLEAAMWMREFMTTPGVDFDIRDPLLIDEMTTFVKKDKKTTSGYEAMRNCHDDRVVCLMWLCWMLKPDVVENHVSPLEYFTTPYGKKVYVRCEPLYPYQRADLLAVKKSMSPENVEFLDNLQVDGVAAKGSSQFKPNLVIPPEVKKKEREGVWTPFNWEPVSGVPQEKSASERAARIKKPYFILGVTDEGGNFDGSSWN